MNIARYIKEHGTAVFYRVTDYPSKRLLEQVKDKSLEKSIREAVYKEAPEGVHIFISDISYYPYGKSDRKIASFVVFSLDRVEGESVYNEEIRKSKEIRKELKKYVKNKILPFVKNLDVIGSILIGDIIDKSKYPTKYSDIDIVLLTDKQYPHKSIKDLIKKLKESPGKVKVNAYNLPGWKITSRVIKKKGDVPVEYNLISYPKFVSMYKTWKRKHKLLPKYSKVAFSSAEVLTGRDAAEDFIRKVIELTG